MTLAFVPATQADADLIASYLPKPHADGTPIQPSEFPTSLPGYLINVKPELRVEGQVVASGGVFTMGTGVIGEGGFTQYDFSGWDLSTDSTLVARQTSAVGLSLQGISANQLTTLKTRMEQTQAKLQAQDLTGLTGENITGDLLTATVWGYFATLQSFGKIAQRQAGMIDNPGLSYGLFHAMVVPNMFFGIPTTVKFPGVLMDIGHLRHNRIAKDDNAQAWINYNRMRGQQASAMEHAVPEQLFTDPNATTKPEGVSAVKAIAVAAAQGQKIFTITQANAAVALPQLQQRADMMEEIQNAIAAGKEVTVSQGTVTVGGWTGAGYIIVDPQTGAGAYMIEGGANGGGIFGTFMEQSWPLALLSLALSLSTGGIAIFGLTLSAAFIGFVLALVLAIDSLILFLMTSDGNQCDTQSLSVYAVPIVLTVLGGFVADVKAVALFIAAFITDGAINMGWQKLCK